MYGHALREGAGGGWQSDLMVWALVASLTLLPASLVARRVLGNHAAYPSAPRRRLVAIAYLGSGVVPAVAALAIVIERWPWLLIPLAAALVSALIVVRVAVEPLSRLAGAAVTQRDLVVDAAEAERVRLAADLHDGPLADLALLIHDLDDRRDADGAAAARGIAMDLRAIGNDLRLPILDDLGIGPALDWLVTRVARRWGADVDLELATAERLPAPVELAVYRIAQEALRNALEHGEPPIRVWYAADASSATLEVEDAGPGLAGSDGARALGDGRLGLVSMAQRAETIGARLTLTDRPGGGTQVRLVWSGTTP